MEFVADAPGGRTKSSTRCLDMDGFVYIVDRKNDLVITGGENVFPTEVEQALFADPDILEAAVFGVPDPVWVEKVAAAVVLRRDCDATGDVLIQRLKTKLAGYKCPKEIHIRLWPSKERSRQGASQRASSRVRRQDLISP